MNAKPLAAIKTTNRDYANPVDYQHPCQSMARYADFLALHYDANRTRHAYYRQIFNSSGNPQMFAWTEVRE